MNHNELKQHVAEHFNRVESGRGQFVYGEWFAPKHNASLEDLLKSIVTITPLQGGNTDTPFRRDPELNLGGVRA